jgi:tetratricopeptide (TPR) repeat protein
MTVMRKKVISVKDTARLVKQISIDLTERRYITKNDILVLDLVANNKWERPIYFAVTTGDEAYVGLKRYFQLEGLAYRLVPIRQTEMEEAQGGRVATDIMYDNIMNKFMWGGMEKPGVNMDENSSRMTSNLRMQMSILANALINEGKKSKAEKVLDKSLEVMPDENIPFDATVFTMVGAYYDLGKKEKANKLAKKLFDIFEHDLRIYNVQKPNRRAAYSRDMAQCKELLKRLTGLAQQYHEDALAKEFMNRLGNVMSREELMPSDPQMP